MHQSGGVRYSIVRFYERFSAGDAAEFAGGIACAEGVSVCHQDGEWKIVHLHFSVGVPDEQAMELTAEEQRR